MSANFGTLPLKSVLKELAILFACDSSSFLCSRSFKTLEETPLHSAQLVQSEMIVSFEYL